MVCDVYVLFVRVDSFSYTLDDQLIISHRVALLGKVQEQSIKHLLLPAHVFNFNLWAHINKEYKIKIYRKL